jgi:adenylate cyclase
VSEGEPPEGSALDMAAVVERLEAVLLGGGRKYTRMDLAERAGTDPVSTARMWRSMGLSVAADDEVVYTDADLAALGRIGQTAEDALLDERMLSAMTRMIGQSFARLASWQGQLAIDVLSGHPDMLSSEDSIVEFATRMLTDLEQLQMYVWRRQLAAYLARIASAAGGDASSSEHAAAVGFADISGFTRLTRQSSDAELIDLLEAFESTAADVVGAHRGRVVKTIGDEVLFVADGPGAGAEIALDLLEACALDERLPSLRIGVAAGPVVSRLGDVFGSTVNIASRLTSLSRPGWVLVDRIMADALAENPAFELRSRRPEAVRGYHRLYHWRLRRAEDRRIVAEKRAESRR